MARLGTTTYGNRNTERIAKAKQEAISRGLIRPSIIEIGAGGVINFLSYFFHDMEHKDRGKFKRMNYGLVKIAESVLRKTGIFNLETFETEEIIDSFRDLNPRKVYIVDIESKVIDAVRKKILPQKPNMSLEFGLIDVSREQLPHTGDIILAYNVLERVENKDYAVSSIANAVNGGGLLSTTFDITIPEFKKIDEGLYLKK